VNYEDFIAGKRLAARPVASAAEMVIPPWLIGGASSTKLPPGLLATGETGPVFIYALGDPETGLIRYIGKTTNLEQRYTAHVNSPPTNCHRSHWIQSLKAKGLRPLMVVVEIIEGAWPWQEAERNWIARGRREGWPLTNNTNGGDGVPGLPAETRQRMAATWRGRKHKPATIEKLRAARALRVTSAATRAKMSASLLGRRIAWVDKVAAGLRKLNEGDIDAIRARLAAGEGTCALAMEFGVHRTTLSKIKVGTYLTQKRGSVSR
jgi:hypothetical protein